MRLVFILLFSVHISCRSLGNFEKDSNKTSLQVYEDMTTLEKRYKQNSSSENGISINTTNTTTNRRKPKTIYGLLGFLTGFRFAQGIGPTSYHADRREDAQLSLFSKLFDGALYLSYIKYPYFYPLATLIPPGQNPTTSWDSDLEYLSNSDDGSNLDSSNSIKRQMQKISQQLFINELENGQYSAHFANENNAGESHYFDDTPPQGLLPIIPVPFRENDKYAMEEDKPMEQNNNKIEKNNTVTKSITNSNKINDALQLKDIHLKIEPSFKNGTNSNETSTSETSTTTSKPQASSSTTVASTTSPSTTSQTSSMTSSTSSMTSSTSSMTSSTSSMVSSTSSINSSTSSINSSATSSVQVPSSNLNESTTTESSVNDKNMTIIVNATSGNFYPYPYYHYYGNASKYDHISITEIPTASHSDFHPQTYYFDVPEYETSNFEHSDFVEDTKYPVPLYPYKDYYVPDSYLHEKHYYEKPKYSTKMEESGFVPLGTLSNKL